MKNAVTTLRKAVPWLSLLFVLPLVVWTAGCDSDSINGGNGGGGGGGGGSVVAPYDTTDDQSNGRPVIEVEEIDAGGVGYEDADGNQVDEVTWTSDYVYLLKGRVFVNDGQTLNIEPGTIIQGEYRANPDQASVLVVARGGTINADGTANEPIIFTAEGDDVSDPDDIGFETRSAWGGVIILGRAPLNSEPGETAIEGFPAENEPRGIYGGDDPDDDSGTFRYCSIRYGGISIGSGNEINGLTMGGVGRGTTIEYVEVFNNLDDGFEWFGGTVNTRYLVSAFNGDDSFDIDEGYRGKNQFFVVVQAEVPADRGGEHDGGTDPEDGEPYATPHIYNATYIGSGAQSGTGDVTLKLRDNFAGSYYNSIFTDFPQQAVEIEDLAEGEGTDSRDRFEEGTLQIVSNIFYNFGAGDTWRDLVENEGNFGDDLAAYLEDNNRMVDPQLGGISRTNDGGLSPVPAAGSPAASGAMPVLDEDSDFVQDVDYVGAFEPGGENWMKGWTFLDQAGFLQ